MDQNIKNRLVGIIVIFALAVIFLPMILDGSGVRKDKLDVVIPPQPLVSANPEFESKIVELQKNVDALPELEARYVDEETPRDRAESSTTDDAQTSTQAAAKKQPRIAAAQQAAKVDSTANSGAEGDSFVLQVGSFQDRGKALAQRDRLRKSKIAAVFIEQFKIDNKSSFRVRLGPFLNRAQSRVAQNKIKAKHDIDGIIMKYER